MAWNRSTCLVLALSFVAQELQAWPLQPPNRKARSIDDRAQDLFATLRNDPDETKRAVAAEELRLVDPKQHSELLGCLIDALRNDKRPLVRAEAASSLGKIKGIHDSVGMALENALANDTSMRVRLQARSSLMGYYLAGYRSANRGSKGPDIAEDSTSTNDALERLVGNTAKPGKSSEVQTLTVEGKTVSLKETTSQERLGFRLIPAWISRRESTGMDSSPKPPESRWWAGRLPLVLPRPTISPASTAPTSNNPVKEPE